MFKRRLDPNGKPIESTGVKHEMGPALKSDVLDKHGNGSTCGSCYGAEEVSKRGGGGETFELQGRQNTVHETLVHCTCTSALKSGVLDKHGNGSTCGSCYDAEEVGERGELFSIEIGRPQLEPGTFVHCPCTTVLRSYVLDIMSRG